MEILLPIPDQAATGGGTLAPRLPTLQGKTLGLVSNGWHSLDITYQVFRILMAEHYGVSEFVERRKTLSSPLAQSDFEEMVRRCDGVIVGLGN